MRNKRLQSWAWLVWLLIPVLLTACSRRGGGGIGGARPHNPPGNSVSSGSSGDRDGPGLGDLPVPDIEIEGDDITGGSSGGSSGGGSGGGSGGEGGGSDSSGGDSGDEPSVPDPDPTDPTEDAFRAVDQGTCLPIYRDGEDWVVSVPPAAVSCQTQRGELFFVTRVADSSTTCPSGVGQDTWSYHSSVTGNTTTLCLNRVWVKNYCVLAEQSGDTITSIGDSTAVDCDATRVPVPYNQVLVVAGVYQASPGAGAANCPTSSSDTRRYWSLLADDGDTLVCFTGRS